MIYVDMLEVTRTINLKDIITSENKTIPYCRFTTNTVRLGTYPFSIHPSRSHCCESVLLGGFARKTIFGQEQ